MDNVEQLAHIDWWYVFFAVVLLLLCIKLVWSLLDWLLFEKLGIETKKMKEAREQSELLNVTVASLKALEAKHNKDESALEKRLKCQEESNREHWEISKQIRQELADSIKTLANTIKEVADDNQIKGNQINSLIVADKEMLAEKINEKYKYYISINGIPEDEYDEFVSLHKAYNGVGGNSHGDAKFEYCMEHLPIIPVDTHLVIKHKD